MRYGVRQLSSRLGSGQAVTWTGRSTSIFRGNPVIIYVEKAIGTYRGTRTYLGGPFAQARVDYRFANPRPVRVKPPKKRGMLPELGSSLWVTEGVSFVLFAVGASLPVAPFVLRKN
jgi:hypothetical protein